MTVWTTPIRAQRPRPGIPIYAFTPSRTGSAAVAFAFFLQQSGCARTVGESMAGAGHNVALLALPGGPTATISNTHVMFAGNHHEWERVGIRPDIPAAAASALDSALAAAHRAIRP